MRTMCFGAKIKDLTWKFKLIMWHVFEVHKRGVHRRCIYQIILIYTPLICTYIHRVYQKMYTLILFKPGFNLYTITFIIGVYYKRPVWTTLKVLLLKLYCWLETLRLFLWMFLMQRRRFFKNYHFQSITLLTWILEKYFIILFS